jgi:hypothetical protein
MSVIGIRNPSIKALALFHNREITLEFDDCNQSVQEMLQLEFLLF